jgi:hypothetical protein
MFPETDEISNIISDTIKVVFKRRLVDRVLRLWTEMARGQKWRVDKNFRALKRHRRRVAATRPGADVAVNPD